MLVNGLWTTDNIDCSPISKVPLTRVNLKVLLQANYEPNNLNLLLSLFCQRQQVKEILPVFWHLYVYISKILLYAVGPLQATQKFVTCNFLSLRIPGTHHIYLKVSTFSFKLFVYTCSRWTKNSKKVKKKEEFEHPHENSILRRIPREKSYLS